MLFGGTIDWALLTRHWQDLMQVVLSIAAGKVSSATILRRLSTDSKRHWLYRVFRELGRVIRTRFLLTYLSNLELRQEIQASTNKVESYHRFAQWLFFGGEGTLADQDPTEAEKALKYADVVASAVILHNVVDMTAVIRQLITEGVTITPADVATLSPYLTRHIRRFGDYTIVPNGDTHPLDAALTWTWAVSSEDTTESDGATGGNTNNASDITELTR